jgi:transposase-like protein
MARRRDLREDAGKVGILVSAVDRAGKTMDFRLSSKPDVIAAKAIFRKAIETEGCEPPMITLDGYAASHRAVRETRADGTLPDDMKLQSSE